MTEGDVGEGVGLTFMMIDGDHYDSDHLMMTLVTTEPPLWSVHQGVIILRGAARGDEGEILDTDS